MSKEVVKLSGQDEFIKFLKVRLRCIFEKDFGYRDYYISDLFHAIRRGNVEVTKKIHFE